VKELFTMWRHTKMVVLAAVTAALYAGLMLPFKAIVIVPGFTELRPAVCIPIVFGLLFGPAAAWGSAIGNVIGDALGGMLGPTSAFGFLGNFLLAAIPFAVYKSFRKMGDPPIPTLTGAKNWLLFIGVVIAASAACAATIGIGVDLFKFFPYTMLASVIFINNVVMPVIIGPILLALLAPRVRRWGVFWWDILRPDEIGRGIFPRLFCSVQLAAIAAGFVAGYFVSMTTYGAELARSYAFGAGPTGPQVPIFVAPFVAVVIACFFFE
jgi:energy-coupling factor transport system substrate-specific component